MKLHKWIVTVTQIAKENSTPLNNFTFTIEAKNKEEAEIEANKQVRYWATRYPIHVKDGTWADYQVRIPKSRITWEYARNIITSIKQIK